MTILSYVTLHRYDSLDSYVTVTQLLDSYVTLHSCHSVDCFVTLDSYVTVPS